MNLRMKMQEDPTSAIQVGFQATVRVGEAAYVSRKFCHSMDSANRWVMERKRELKHSTLPFEFDITKTFRLSREAAEALRSCRGV